MTTKVKPIITGLDKQIPVDLGKRLEDIGGDITFQCPSCDNVMSLLSDTADLEYGSFHGTNSCWECGQDFEEYFFDVKATVTISINKETK